MPFPFNRVVAFIGPYVSIVAGAVASWLLLRVHVLGALGFGHDQVASAIAFVVTFGVTTSVTWLGHQKWLTGHQNWEANILSLVHYIPAGLPDSVFQALLNELEKTLGIKIPQDQRTTLQSHLEATHAEIEGSAPPPSPAAAQ